MAKLILNGATSGSITLESPSVSGSNTLTLPANTGTVITTGSTFGGTGPAFSAYANSSDSVSGSTWTKIPASVEEFDTNSNYDNATNYRFTPTVAGYYQVNGQVALGGTITRLFIAIRKNGSEFKLGNDLPTASNRAIICSLIYMNGTTDYLELYVFATGTTLTFTGTVGADSVFSASMVRSA